MKTIDEMISVMKAYEGGKKIQYFSSKNEIWIDVDGDVRWNWGLMDYRVKPDIIYVPYDNIEEVIAAQKIRGNKVTNKNWLSTYNCYVGIRDANGVILLSDRNEHWTISFDEFLRDYVWEYDETPCGKLVED